MAKTPGIFWMRSECRWSGHPHFCHLFAFYGKLFTDFLEGNCAPLPRRTNGLAAASSLVPLIHHFFTLALAIALSAPHNRLIAGFSPGGVRRHGEKRCCDPVSP